MFASSLLLSISLSSLAGLSFAQAPPTVAPCPLLGHVYPAPKNFAGHPAWKDATLNLTDTLSQLPGLMNASMAIQIVAKNNAKPVYEHYYKAPSHVHGADGKKEVDGDSIFRIGSVTKLWTVYAMLIECGFECFEDPITKYIPELEAAKTGDALDTIQWKDITLGAIASHLGGIGRDYALGDYGPSMKPQVALGSGLPPLETADPKCGATPAQEGCDRPSSLDLILKEAPILSPFDTPSYSNSAYQLVGYALEKVTGKTYEEVMTSTLFRSVGMDRTSVFLPPSQADGVLIPGDPIYNWTIKDESPAGSVYTTANDMSKLTHALLENKHLSALQMKRWLKPTAHTADLHFSVGMPWEIERLQGTSKNYIIDAYTKSGGIGTYTAQSVLIPEMDIGLNIQVVSSGSLNALAVEQAVFKAIVPALETIAKEQGSATIGGTYTSKDMNSTLTLSSDNEIGLVIENWISNSTDMIQVLAGLGYKDTARVYPMGMHADNGDKGTKQAYRAIWGRANEFYCLSWGSMGFTRYGAKPLDQMVFEVGKDGKATAVSLPGLRIRLEKEK